MSSSALCENYTSKGKFFIGVALPSSIAIIATYTVHSLKGTPNPELSTIPTLIFYVNEWSMTYWTSRKFKNTTRDINIFL